MHLDTFLLLFFLMMLVGDLFYFIVLYTIDTLDSNVNDTSMSHFSAIAHKGNTETTIVSGLVFLHLVFIFCVVYMYVKCFLYYVTCVRF